jgi:hypothetical protein
VNAVHVGLGWGVVIGFGLLMLGGLVAWLRKLTDAGRWFWSLLAVLQVLVGLQIVAGIALLVLGRRQDLLHYLYGGVFPFLVLVTAHVVSRTEDRPAHLNFAWASFFSFGLTLRALMTGLEMG